MVDCLPTFDFRPEPGVRTDFGIGIVGAGSIVEAAHLPAYRKAGFHVVGITDINVERAHALAARCGIPRVYLTVDELLADPNVEIVDIAVPPWSQSFIVTRALEAGKHLLCQKPLASTASEAQSLVDLAERAGRWLAVNENMRWDPAMRASRSLLRDGWIGTAFLAVIEVNYHENWGSWPWLTESEHLTIMFDAIHPLYCLRMLFGEPDRVFCITGRLPDQKERGETRAIITLEFPGGLTCLLIDCSTNPTDDHFATFRFDGTEGSIKGTLGIWYDYPTGRPDLLEFTSKRKSSGVWLSAKFESRWVPDGFIGPMASLMSAIHKSIEPENSGREHVKTLQLVEAAYRSSAERRPIAMREMYPASKA
jgi:predicted dehydrogenase